MRIGIERLITTLCRAMVKGEDMAINIENLTDEDIGRWVRYCPSFGEPEKGRIKSWNQRYIFVVYKCDNQWHRYQDFTAAATSPFDLQWV